jgi:glyoxylase-like metal-dependent hydrolase (beta-lactamase superfamily II)
MTQAPASPTARDQWDAWNDRRLPGVEQVRPGVWSIPVPVPDNPIRYTLCYAFVFDGEALVLDPGWDSDEGWGALAAGLAQAGVGPTVVTGIVVTHYHADHLGLGVRLVRASGAWLALGAAERAHQVTHDFVAIGREKFSRWGVPDELMGAIGPGQPVLNRLAGLAVPDRWLEHGEVIEAAGSKLRVIATPGHSTGHICLVDDERGLLFTGDHVLPRISPNVPFEPHGLTNPLATYLRSLDDVQLGEHLEVCPAHEYRFHSIAGRGAEIRKHTLDRSEEVRRVLSTGRCHTVWDVARKLTWSRGWDSLTGISMRLALSETASHLRYLESLGEGTGVRLVANAESDD